MPSAVAESRRVERLSREAILNLAIGLPLRDPAGLEAFLADVTDPASPRYQHYLNSEEFTARFGPTPADYQAAIDFAQAHGLTVVSTHPNRIILDVSGTVAQVESALHVNLMVYQHPKRGRFFAPDREPTLDGTLTIQDISGLDNFTLPRPMNMHAVPLSQATPFYTGSGPVGLFIGKDFRAAYAPGVTLTGTGQTLGLVEFDGFYASDVAANFQQAGMTPVPTQTVLLDGFNGAPGSSNIEVTLDIMMAAYMAPGLSKIVVYEGTQPNDILNRMATDNTAKQLSCSWGFSPINGTTEQIFKQFIAQGQTLFVASGDNGAYTGPIMPPSDDPNVTSVGGTSLTTSGSGGPWLSETTWSGSGGGVSTVYPIPSYQQGLNMGANGGSLTRRNIPDVALMGDVQIFLIQNNGQAVRVGGTSAATPLWAGFIALANQQSAANNKPPVGFLNPLIYGIGKTANAANDLHDITTGNNSGFSAVSGYDLATGWGSPSGQHLINDLAGAAATQSFTLSTSTATLAIRPGTSGTATVTVTPQGGFSGSVSLTASGLPAGVTASFSPASTTSTSILTLTVSASAAVASATITITGTSGSLHSTATIGLTTATPDFSLTASPASVTVAAGSNGATTLSATAINGFSGTITLSISGLPAGVTAGFSAGTTSGTLTLSFIASSSATAGTSTVTVTGTSGGLTHTASIALTITAPAGSGTVSLSRYFNVTGIVTDGVKFTSGGLDGGGRAYSSSLLGTSVTFNGTAFTIGAANTPDAVTSATVALPAGQYTSLRLLAAGVNGNQASQTFVVHYTDGSTSTFKQSLSDWVYAQSYPGESIAWNMSYRDNSDGTRDVRPMHLYGYSFNLNATKTVASLTLPNNRNVVVLAVSVVRGTAQVTPAKPRTH